MADNTAQGTTAAPARTPYLIRVTDTVNAASDVCKHTSAGLDMLLLLLATSDLEPWLKESFTGLLRPMVGELERTHAALRDTIQ